MHDPECNICLEIMGQPSTELGDTFNSIVSQGKNVLLNWDDFLVIPSLGPLDETHVMIVPKFHIESFAALPLDKRKVAEEIIKGVDTYASHELGEDLLFFESGAGKLTTHSGGCIIHAHIHCLHACSQFEKRLFEEVELDLGKSNFEGLDLNFGYLWYLGSDRKPYCKNNPLLPSQFMRYLYATSCGGPGLWNWRKNLCNDVYETALSKYENLSEHFMI